ncbi:MAG: hypothetical protein ABIS28_01315 [Caldimonas sp.]
MYGLIELGLVFGSVLALAVWELIRLRREMRRDRERAEQVRGDDGSV